MQSTTYDKIKYDVKKKRQYFRKGNTTNLPEKIDNQLSPNRKNGTLSNDDCKT